MKLSFSTLGCPDWTWQEILEQARHMGFTGLEIRGIEGVMNAWEIPQFSEEQRKTTREELKNAGLTICGFGSSIRLHEADKYEETMALGRKEIEACAAMGIHQIRVFGNNIPDPDREAETIALVSKGISELCDYAKVYNVNILLEVHGDFTTVERLLPICKDNDEHENFGLIWDIMHSDRVYLDRYEDFYTPLKKWIRHIHVKDYAVDEDGKVTLCLTGEGRIPIRPIIRTLQSDGYDGWFSLEWEKKWHPELPDPLEAFPQYVEYMKQL